MALSSVPSLRKFDRPWWQDSGVHLQTVRSASMTGAVAAAHLAQTVPLETPLTQTILVIAPQ